MEKLYKIVRMNESGRTGRVQAHNLTLRQAQAWCNDPETSSMTARQPRGCEGNDKTIARWHAKQKHWFDGFTEQ